ncbi:MAG: cyclic nucleotide-binding domain-containing protein [Proteobacteria bacterium]|nr:cyclic nucleotide-binding domain-containing protein [Pseudomonadota bacterium]
MSDVQKFINTCTTMLNENINEQECDLLSSAFQLRKLAVDEVLLREGEKDDTLYIVIEGDVIVTRDAGGDEHVTLQHLKPGDIAGAMGFIDGSSHSATLSATRASHVLELHRDVLEGMIDAHPQLVYKIMKMIVRSVHKTMLQMNRQFVEMNNYIMKEHGRY